MLIDPNGKRKDNLPHEQEFHLRRLKLSDAEYDAVVAEVGTYCDSHPTVKCTYLASGDWTGTPREALMRACDGDMEEAAKFLGQILWLVVRDRSETWWFYRPEGLEGEVEGMFYARQD